MKYILGLSVLMAIWCYYLNYRIDVLKEQNKALESEKNSLNLSIKQYEINSYKANKEIANLKKKISEDSSALDWYNHPIPDIILKEINK